MTLNDIYVPEYVKHVAETLNGDGRSAYLVGGSVRDMLLGRTPKDYDVCTCATPTEVVKLFSGKGLRVIDTGSKYGTVTVLIGEGQVEVTTYRTDGVYSDGRRPDSVIFGTKVVDDVIRRDFTINGMLMQLETQGATVLDYIDGTLDLDRRVIRCIGVAACRFEEDALRMLRAIRFAAQLDFDIEDRTFNVIKDQAHTIVKVSKERINAELTKILLSNHPRKGFELLYKSGLMTHILNSVAKLKYFDQRNHRHNKDIFDHTMTVVESVQPELTLRLAALMHDVGKPSTFSVDENGVGHFYGHHKTGADMTREILHDLRFPSEVIEDVGVLVYEHMSRNPYFRQTGIKRLINRVGEQRIDRLFELMYADVIGHAPPHDFSELSRLEAEVTFVRNSEEPMAVKNLHFGGKDLMAMGLPPGPIYSEILNHLLELVLDQPDLNQHQTLQEEAEKYLKSKRD